jgi:hypothetical protein
LLYPWLSSFYRREDLHQEVLIVTFNIIVMASGTKQSSFTTVARLFALLRSQ